MTAGIGIGVALLATLLLFASAYLTHAVTHKPGSSDRTFSLWDILKLDNTSATTVSFPVAISFMISALYFALRSRRVRLRGPWVPRVWALASAVVNLLVIIHVAGLGAGFQGEIVEVSRGVGFYVMIVAGVVMVLGSLVAVLAPQPSPTKPDERSLDTAAKATTEGRRSPEPAPKPPAPEPDVAARLRALNSLLDEGLITEAEYTDRRNHILDDL